MCPNMFGVAQEKRFKLFGHRRRARLTLADNWIVLEILSIVQSKLKETVDHRFTCGQWLYKVSLALNIPWPPKESKIFGWKYFFA